AGGYAFGDHFDHGANRGAGLADGVEIIGPCFGGFGVGAEERVLIDLLPIEIGVVDLVRADLDERSADGDLWDHEARDGAGGDTRGGFARRGPAAAAIVADAVFLEIGVVGVSRTELVADLGIILGTLVGIFDEQGNRRAGGAQSVGALVLEDAGKDFDLVGLAALGGVARLAGLAAIEIALDRLGADRQAGGAAIDDDAKRGPMAFAAGGEAEQVAEGVVAHEMPRKW